MGLHKALCITCRSWPASLNEMPSLNSLTKFFVLSLIRFGRFPESRSQEPGHSIRRCALCPAGDPVSALLSLQRWVDLDLLNRPRPPFQHCSSGISAPRGRGAQFWSCPRRGAAPPPVCPACRSGDEIRLSLHLMAACGKAEVLL